jgi:RHS repeat-associated protein
LYEIILQIRPCDLKALCLSWVKRLELWRRLGDVYFEVDCVYFGDYNELVYLRARFYAPGMGRFLTKDPSGLESNLFLYTSANPINRIDPTGLFSVELIEKNLHIMQFVSTSQSKDHSKWGFYALLLEAENGDVVSTGNVNLAAVGIPDYTPFPGLIKWSTPRTIYENGCNRIIIGHQFLDEYFRSVVDKNDPAIWWRDTASEVYQLYEPGSVPVNYWDAFDNDIGTYPNYVGF